MIVDSSALLAIVFDEPEGHDFGKLIVSSGEAKLPAASYVEVSLKLDRGLAGRQNPLLEQALAVLRLEILAMSVQQARLARDAFNRFGNGNGGPLNFGDCLSYAAARELDLPLLFKGNDFTRTDVIPAWPAGARP